MAVNLKLAHAVKDRVVQSFQLNGSELVIIFVGASTMTVTRLILAHRWNRWRKWSVRVLLEVQRTGPAY